MREGKSSYDIVAPAKGKHHAIFQILITGPNGRRGSCSAFAVSDTRAITAGHCINNINEIYIVRNIYGQDTGVRARSIVKVFGLNDYGILSGNFKDFEKIPIKKGLLLHEGEHFKSCGFAGGKVPPICTDFTAVGSHVFYYGGKGYFSRGMSGGPLINKDGVAVGIISHVNGKYVYVNPIVGVLDFNKDVPKF